MPARDVNYTGVISVIILLAACAPKTGEDQAVTSSDSTTDTEYSQYADSSDVADFSDTASFEYLGDELEEQDIYGEPMVIDTAEAEQRVASLIAEYNNHPERYLHLGVEEVESGEFGMSVWLFSQTGSLRYFYEEWNRAESGGSRYCFFEDGKLVGFQEEEVFAAGGNIYQIAYLNLPSGSFLNENDDGRIQVNVISNEMLVARTSEFTSRLNILIQSVKNGKNVSETPGEMTIATEVNYDTEAGNRTMKTMISLPEKLYSRLVK